MMVLLVKRYRVGGIWCGASVGTLSSVPLTTTVEHAANDGPWDGRRSSWAYDVEVGG